MNCSSSTTPAMASSHSQPSTEAAVDIIACMCRQEIKGYATVDVFRQKHLALPVALDVDPECRAKMAAWMYQVVDFCKFTRESAEIALSYLDRFLVTTSGLRALQDRSVFQLAAMACLYTSVKIHEPEAMDPQLVSSLSRGVYTPTDIEQMEYIVLHALDWRVNPPTTLSFVREFLHLIPLDALDSDTRDAVYQVAQAQTERAVAEYAFVEIPASWTAYAATLNALQRLSIDATLIHCVGLLIHKAIGFGTQSPSALRPIQSYLWTLIVDHPLAVEAQRRLAPPIAPSDPLEASVSPSPPTKQRSAPLRTISPRSIAM